LAESSASRLDLLYRISQTINSSLDLDVVMESLMDEVILATHAERGFLMLFDEQSQLSFRTARGMDQQDIEESEFKISRGIVERAAQEAIPLLTSNAQLDQRFDSRASVKLYGLRSVLCVPIIQKGKTLGVIYVDNRFQNGIFMQEDLDLLTSIASSAGIAIDNARLYRIAVEKGRMERELQMAREVQVSLIPASTPVIPGWDLAACWKPAHEVSGDFYDFIPISDGKYGIVVADVSDKGMPAALFMALSRSVIRSIAGQHARLDEEISKANHLIWRDSLEGMFITLFYALLRPDSGDVTYVNAGHNPPLLLRSKSMLFETLSRTGMAAGVEDKTAYAQVTLTLAAGDYLVMFTDGVTDAQIGDAPPFGEEHLMATILKHTGKSAQGMIDAIEKEVCEFSGGGEPVDDLTLLIARRTGGNLIGEE
jgi:sigma-B regulation protein RsbU (phosphoserine phosphatase)